VCCVCVCCFVLLVNFFLLKYYFIFCFLLYGRVLTKIWHDLEHKISQSLFAFGHNFKVRGSDNDRGRDRKTEGDKG